MGNEESVEWGRTHAPIPTPTRAGHQLGNIDIVRPQNLSGSVDGGDTIGTVHVGGGGILLVGAVAEQEHSPSQVMINNRLTPVNGELR